MLHMLYDVLHKDQFKSTWAKAALRTLMNLAPGRPRSRRWCRCSLCCAVSVYGQLPLGGDRKKPSKVDFTNHFCTNWFKKASPLFTINIFCTYGKMVQLLGQNVLVKLRPGCCGWLCGERWVDRESFPEWSWIKFDKYFNSDCLPKS